ncbi:MAG TPA: Na-translocating system protein MpsC family protein [Acidimicrobiales bacterium]|nr:Na-translocating system protein MpsC family protein [Acidimicrobiales bacterium]
MEPSISREQRAAIGEVIVRLERQFYGRGPSSVRVSVTEDSPVSIVALSIDSLTAADRTLNERGGQDAVRRHVEELNAVTREDFVRAIEDIVGQPVTAYLAQIHPLTGYGIRVFLFDEGDQTEI